MSVPGSAAIVRKVVPKVLAVIDADSCSGCRACVEVCPAACIDAMPGERHPGVASFCEIDLDRCIGCRECARICPWGAAEMVATPSVAARVASKGGPAGYVARNGGALVERARRNVDKFLARRRN